MSGSARRLGEVYQNSRAPHRSPLFWLMSRRLIMGMEVFTSHRWFVIPFTHCHEGLIDACIRRQNLKQEPSSFQHPQAKRSSCFQTLNSTQMIRLAQQSYILALRSRRVESKRQVYWARRAEDFGFSFVIGFQRRALFCCTIVLVWQFVSCVDVHEVARKQA